MTYDISTDCFCYRCKWNIWKYVSQILMLSIPVLLHEERKISVYKETNTQTNKQTNSNRGSPEGTGAAISWSPRKKLCTRPARPVRVFNTEHLLIKLSMTLARKLWSWSSGSISVCWPSAASVSSSFWSLSSSSSPAGSVSSVERKVR